MPNSNGWFRFAKLGAGPNGTQLITAGGPLGDVDPSVFKVEVRTVLTQEPLSKKRPDNPAAAFAVTVTGEAVLHGPIYENPWWQFETVAPNEFEPRWARGTAVALLVSRSGETETRSWSRWVWIDNEAEYYDTALADAQKAVNGLGR
jgi:hypothetical protein